MTLEERYELSCYEELTRLSDEKPVWLVRHNETGQIYVKKKMSLYNMEVYRRLKKENFDNIPRVRFCAEDEEGLVVIEEYIHGMSLEERVDKTGALPEGEALGLMIDLCGILEKLHGAVPPIIHRDIKPSNIMISTDGVLKLIDFNAARQVSSGKGEKDTRLMGTRGFAAPEQYGFSQSDQRTDIYALGVTLTYILTGGFMERESYHGGLENIIKKCTAMEKNERYESVKELEADLENYSAYLQTGRRSFKKSRPYRKNLPVGFRSGSPLKMAVAAAGYLVIFYLSFGLEFADQSGTAVSDFELWANRLGMLAMMLGTVCFLGNYRNIRYALPFMKSGRVLHWLMAAVYLFVFCWAVVLILAVMETMVQGG